MKEEAHMEKEARSQKPEARRGISAWGPIIRAFRSTLQTSGFWLLASGFFLLLPPLRAEVIDRIMAVVEGHIVTRGDLRQEREIRERLGEKPVEDDKALVQELIDNYLIERQIADYPGVDVSNEEVDEDLRKSVSREGRPSQAVLEATRRRIRRQKYFDLRFRQFIRPPDDEVRKYYEDVFVPEARSRGVNPIPPLNQIVDAVRNNVIEENLNHEINVWLEAIRRRSNIEVFE